MMWGYGFNSINITLMMLGSTLWIVLLIVLVLGVLRWLKARAPRQTQTLPESDLTAIEILSQRYARGEIDATAFEQMRERLEATDTVHQRSSVQVPRPAGERLFDSSEIL